MYNKEKIYKQEIQPLMDEIIKICKKNNIQMFSSFYLKENTEENNEELCSSYISSEEKNTEKLQGCLNIVYEGQNI